MHELALRRLHNQRLTDAKLETPAAVVGWLGAMQAQEYAHAKWALGLRMDGATDKLIEQAFTDGDILRTHVMRPTWHFVTPEEIRWLLALTAPRVHTVNGSMYRKLELDDVLLAHATDVLAKALQGGNHLTRKQLGDALAQAGINYDGLRLAYIVMYAELEAILCSGPRRGKQFTYALLNERAPQAKTLPHDEALVTLTKRFFTSHGPATVDDFAWWSGLTKAEVRAGLEMTQPDIIADEIDGQTYWRAASNVEYSDEPSSPTAWLLPPYDEYGIAYKTHHASIIDPDHIELAKNSIFGGTIMIDGQILGYWRRSFNKGAVEVELMPFRPLTAVELEAVEMAVQRFGEFIEMPVALLDSTSR